MLQRIVDTVVNELNAAEQAKPELTSRNFRIRYVGHYRAKFKEPKGETVVKVEKQRERFCTRP